MFAAADADATVNVTERSYRAGPQGYIIWSTIFGGLTALALWDTVHRGPSFWEAVVVFAALWVFAIVWVAAFEIRITEDELMFRALFGGTKRIQRSQIRKVSLGFGLSAWGGPLRLCVHPKTRTAPRLSINAKVFSREALRAVLDLGEQTSAADAEGLEHGVVMRTLRKRRRRNRARGA